MLLRRCGCCARRTGDQVVRDQPGYGVVVGLTKVGNRFEVPGYEEGAFGIFPESDIVSDHSNRAEDGGVSPSDKDVYTFPELIAFRFS